MEFNQKQQFTPQTLQSQISPATISRQQLATLPSSLHLAFYQQSLIKVEPIHILTDGNFTNFSPSLKGILYLTIPTHPSDELALEALHTFYSENEFLLSIQTIPGLLSISNAKSTTRIAILFGPPTNPGGGSAELFPLLSLPSLTHLRLIFQDRQFKDVGPSRLLRSCIAFILKVRDEQRIALKPHLKTVDEEEPKNVTIYLDPLSEEEKAVVKEEMRRVDAYMGPASSYVTILIQSGWEWEFSDKVMSE